MHEISGFIRVLIAAVRETAETARSRGIASGLSLACTANHNNPSGYVGGSRETTHAVLASAILREPAWLLPATEAIDGKIEFILIDVEEKVTGWQDAITEASQRIQHSVVYTYKPNDITVVGADALLAELIHPLAEKTVAVLGAGNIGGKIALRLAERGAEVKLWRRDKTALETLIAGLKILLKGKGALLAETDIQKAATGVEVIVGCTPGIPIITDKLLFVAASDVLVLDVGNGTLSGDAVAYAHSRGLRVLCLTPQAAFAGAFETMRLTRELVSERIGRCVKGNIAFISGGILGVHGDVIVDDFRSPSRVLGIADGKGDVVPDLTTKRYRKIIQEAALWLVK